MTEEDTEYSWWDKAKLNFWNLVQSDSEDQFDATVGESMDKGQGVDYKVGLLINSATMILGAAAYQFIGGLIGLAGLVFAILSALSILKWVIQG